MLALIPLALLAAPTAGTVSGGVAWAGPIPVAPRLEAALPDGLGANPYDPRTADVVVMLRGVDPARAKPWDLPPVRVDVSRQTIRVTQGDRAGRVGFVRKGDSVPMRWEAAQYRNLRARGAAFWSLAFPDGSTVRMRRFDAPGLVRLSSGTGEFWLAADLWVCEHPYFTTTDANGNFRFDGVPPGEYDVVAWLPDWREAGRDRDPETGIINRVRWAPPKEVSRRARAGERVQLTLH